MKSKYSIFILFFCIYSMSVQSASKGGNMITGVVLEKETHTPIEYVGICVYLAKTDKFVTGTVSNANGKFTIQSLPDDMYYCVLSYIGYEKQKSASFTVNESQNIINLGNFYLITSSQQLNEVVVQGRRSTYTQGIDKKIFNVGQDLMSSSGSLSDLLQNIPSVQVDVEGNVSLRGNENVQILINGKQSTMMNARTRAEVLQQLPAGDIERIEIITNPSAQYKPDGVSGILNIVMKKQRKVGVNGNVMANIGNEGRYNVTTSINYNTGKINLYGSYGIRLDRRDRITLDDRIKNDSVLSYISQHTDSKAHPLSHVIRAGIDWNFDSSNTLQLSGAYNHRGFLREENTLTTNRDDAEIITYNANRYRHDDEKTNQAEGNAVYTHLFGDNNELSVDYSYSILEGLEDNQYTTNIYSTTSETKDNSQIWQAYYQHLFRVTYNRTFNDKIKLTMGYEMDALQTDLNYHFQNLENGVFVPDMQKTNDFTNNQLNNAIYATLEYKVGKFGMLMGLRPELMNIKSHLFSLDSIVSNNYFMVYPTLHTAYQLNDNNELQLNYSLRVNRPEADDMNPFPEYQNPLSLRAGNPYLLPEKIHSIEAGYQWRKSATTILGTLYYRYTADKLTTVTKYLDNSILLTTKENLNSSQSAGLELIINTDIKKWMNINLSGNVYYDQINAEKLGYGKNKNNIAWSSALNANFNIFKGAMLQLNSRYTSSSLLPQGKREGAFITNLGAKYEIPSTNLSIMGTVSDLFNTFKKIYTIDTPQLKQRIEQWRNPRIFYIGIIWNFGSSQHNDKQNLKYDESL
ncbi:Outer membrane receptor proteins, mostly Fe transport [Macellibacteroides fermentans]|uniref:Outer membrane receptor proteins, mostly Fe transport n=3 Tax=root TaxID=1 RepID=A0A1T5DRR6_9BACT|nr:Outer membrane receptor proteins, mostly Fe transport [Parabacteroides chartae]